LVLWAAEAAIAERQHLPARWSWATPLLLLMCLFVTLYYLSINGWTVEKDKDPTLNKLPWVVSLFLGALSLMFLYIQMRT
jgi:hypothetical protein